jgi:two-component system C4-dicarboxylate transport response regulator DctD
MDLVNKREKIMKKKILLVDDNARFRSLIEEIIEGDDEGFSVSVSGDGVSALESLEFKQFDILITDINMPRMDGITLFHKVRALYPQLPVVFISGFVQNSLSDRLLSEGAFHVFNKPFDLILFIGVIKHALESKQPQSKIDQSEVTVCRQ